MKNSTTERWSYCANSVRQYRHDLFLRCLFIPEAFREPLFAISALDIELAHVHHAVQEEMLGHIRYAWWEESLEAIFSGAMLQNHPVLKALPFALIQPCIRLVGYYQSHFPDIPTESEAFLEELLQQVVHLQCPVQEASWHKGKSIIDAHRKRFGAKANSWLYIKLLWHG